MPGAVVPPVSPTCFLNIKAPSHLTDAQLFLSTLLSPGACLPQLKGTGWPFRCPSGAPLTSEGPGHTEAAHTGDPGLPTRGRWGCRHRVLPGTAVVQREGGSAWLRVVGNELLVTAGLLPSASPEIPHRLPWGLHSALCKHTLSDGDTTHLCLHLGSNQGGWRAWFGHWDQRVCSDTQRLSGQVGTQLQVLGSSHFLTGPSDPWGWPREQVRKKRGH